MTPSQRPSPSEARSLLSGLTRQELADAYWAGVDGAKDEILYRWHLREDEQARAEKIDSLRLALDDCAARHQFKPDLPAA